MEARTLMTFLKVVEMQSFSKEYMFAFMYLCYIYPNSLHCYEDYFYEHHFSYRC